MNTNGRPEIKFYLLERDFTGKHDNELNFLYVLAQAADLFGKALTPEEMARVSRWFYAKCKADLAAARKAERQP